MSIKLLLLNVILYFTIAFGLPYESSRVSFSGLPNSMDTAWVAGERYTFQYKWNFRPKDAKDIKMIIKKGKHGKSEKLIAPMVIKKSNDIYKAEIGLPATLPSGGDYRIKFETKLFGFDYAESPYFPVLGMMDAEKLADKKSIGATPTTHESSPTKTTNSVTSVPATRTYNEPVQTFWIPERREPNFVNGIGPNVQTVTSPIPVVTSVNAPEYDTTIYLPLPTSNSQQSMSQELSDGLEYLPHGATPISTYYPGKTFDTTIYLPMPTKQPVPGDVPAIPYPFPEASPNYPDITKNPKTIVPTASRTANYYPIVPTSARKNYQDSHMNNWNPPKQEIHGGNDDCIDESRLPFDLPAQDIGPDGSNSNTYGSVPYPQSPTHTVHISKYLALPTTLPIPNNSRGKSPNDRKTPYYGFSKPVMKCRERT